MSPTATKRRVGKKAKASSAASRDGGTKSSRGRTGAKRASRRKPAASSAVKTKAALLDALPVAIVAVDAAKRITFANDRAGHLVGMNADAMLGVDCDEIFTPEDCDDGCVLDQAMRRREAAESDDCRLAINGGEVRELIVTAAPLFGDGGRIEGGVEILRDVTEQRQKERAHAEELVRIEDYHQATLDLGMGVSECLQTLHDVKGGILTSRVSDEVLNSKDDLVSSLGRALNAAVAEIEEQHVRVEEYHTATMDLSMGISESFQVLADVSAGDLSNRVSDTVLNGTDELLGSLGRSVNNTVENLLQLVTKIQNSSERVGNAANEILAASEQTSAGINTQVERVEEASASIVELSSSIQEVAQNSKSSEELSREGIRTAQEGESAVRATIEVMGAVAQNVEDTAIAIGELGQRGQEIGKIVEVIADIADQTNLLALNAAIEAARAGEQGRGFAVVADHVGKLAERSAKSAKEISTLIMTIQHSTEESVRRMQKGLEVVEAGTKRADDSGAALAAIIKVVEQMARSVSEISIATAQQAKASDIAAEGIEQLSDLARQSSAATEQVVRQARDLSRLSEDLGAQVGEFRL